MRTVCSWAYLTATRDAISHSTTRIYAKRSTWRSIAKKSFATACSVTRRSSRPLRRHGVREARRTSSRFHLSRPRRKNGSQKLRGPEDRPLRIASGGFAGIANLIADDLRKNLGIEVEVDGGDATAPLSGARLLAESKLVPRWDILLNFWFDISSEATPAMIHREFFGADGAFRVGPELPDFDKMYWDMAGQTEGQKLNERAEALDRYTQAEALGLFICSPKSLTAVNNHVKFTPYATTFELAEAEVMEGHWSIKD